MKEFYMSYILLDKAFRNPKMDAGELYQTRFNANNTIHLDLLVSGYPAFCVLDDSLYAQMLMISRADKKILALTQTLPEKAIQQFTERTLIDEIVLTNGIEGVNSSRKEIGYIHPFYDGNGRLNRFISSYLLTKEYEQLVGFRLSYAITHSINKYYKGFTTCNKPLNRGDLTPFVIMFLNIVCQAGGEIVQALSEKDALYKENLGRLRYIPTVANDKDVFNFAAVLLQARMFSGDGITAQALTKALDVSRPTVAKRLSQIESVGLLERERMGREVHLQINLAKLAKMTKGK